MQRRPKIVGVPVKTRLHRRVIDAQHHGEHPPAQSVDVDIDDRRTRSQILLTAREAATVMRATRLRPGLVNRAGALAQQHARARRRPGRPVPTGHKCRAVLRRPGDHGGERLWGKAGLHILRGDQHLVRLHAHLLVAAGAATRRTHDRAPGRQRRARIGAIKTRERLANRPQRFRRLPGLAQPPAQGLPRLKKQVLFRR
ncbi:MAG: hypothetical protein BWX86_01958 [Verrucomicrobia bacterium ADurb.Bin122]|nr:MAG: hypothetical protein BWX86_01958 [Verrucomicrobia bacterium ADurb.Bin122]